ncbi:hypothetical protein MED121_13140 [Marinomonas sp. MED121]|uniref:VOC family protein n=1 Tax=Marinomonas sp. MED121 TaxID=314277 RepID=UPI000068FF6F|nr:VOC family protein [Marinomonas sp. MED121]EAQ66874.1 hypothetical protein MED121_13140 [Marinomonas sp. MED121]
MQQNAVGWFDIYVNDMSRAETFYGTVLQREFEAISDPSDTSVIMKAFVTDMDHYGAGGALVKREGVGPVTGGTMVYFGVEDCAAEESRVEESGGKVINPKMSIGKYGFVSVCMDTEGNLFGLSSFQ